MFRMFFKSFSSLYCLVLPSTIIFLSACQSLPIQSPVSISNEVIVQTVSKSSLNYGQYYLSIKSLSGPDLLAEINQQNGLSSNAKNTVNDNKIERTEEQEEASLKYLLLQSLPRSPIFNPYSAKAKLNKMSFEQDENSSVDSENLAFLTLLKDQLNEQLLLLNQLAQNEQHSLALTQENQQLKQQINLLKKIEQNINEHGQSKK